MQELQLVKQLCDLNSQFKDVEEKSVSFTATPEKHY